MASEIQVLYVFDLQGYDLLDGVSPRCISGLVVVVVLAAYPPIFSHRLSLPAPELEPPFAQVAGRSSVRA
jgi:hypothetical protein